MGGLSASISFLLIFLFILLLNSSTSALPLYPLPLTTLQNSCTNSSIVFPPCSILLSYAILTHSLFSPPDSFFNSNKNSPTSKSSNKFFFHISGDSLCTYKNTYQICSSTDASLICILKYNLHVMINPPTFPASLLNTGGLATSIFLVLGSSVASLPVFPPATASRA